MGITQRNIIDATPQHKEAITPTSNHFSSSEGWRWPNHVKILLSFRVYHCALHVAIDMPFSVINR